MNKLLLLLISSRAVLLPVGMVIYNISMNTSRVKQQLEEMRSGEELTVGGVMTINAGIYDIGSRWEVLYVCLASEARTIK